VKRPGDLRKIEDATQSRARKVFVKKIDCLRFYIVCSYIHCVAFPAFGLYKLTLVTS